VRVTSTDYDLSDPRPATTAEIEAAEAALGVTLPADFVAVARHHQGRAPSPCVFTLEDGTESVFNHLLHFDRSSPTSSLVGAWNDLRDILPSGLVPFAPDPGGNYLCFDFRESVVHPPIAFWAHDDPTGPLQRVAPSFTALLALLHD
jgi:cell wall assembly regulator SMI1